MSNSKKISKKMLAFVLGTTLLSGGLVNIQSVSAMGPGKIVSTNFNESKKFYWNEYSSSSNIEFVTGKKCNYDKLGENDRKVVDSIEDFVLCEKLDESDNFKIFDKHQDIFENDNIYLECNDIKIKILKFTSNNSNNTTKALVCIVVPDGKKLTEECMKQVKGLIIENKIVRLYGITGNDYDYCNVNFMIRPENRNGNFEIEGWAIKDYENLTVNMPGATISGFQSIAYCENLKLNAPNSIIKGGKVGEEIYGCDNSIINIENSTISGYNAIYYCNNSLIFAKNSEITGKRAISCCNSYFGKYRTKIDVSNAVISGEEAIYNCESSKIKAKEAIISGFKAISGCIQSIIKAESATISGVEAIHGCSEWSKIYVKNAEISGKNAICACNHSSVWIEGARILGEKVIDCCNYLKLYAHGDEFLRNTINICYGLEMYAKLTEKSDKAIYDKFISKDVFCGNCVNAAKINGRTLKDNKFLIEEEEKRQREEERIKRQKEEKEREENSKRQKEKEEEIIRQREKEKRKQNNNKSGKDNAFGSAFGLSSLVLSPVLLLAKIFHMI